MTTLEAPARGRTPVRPTGVERSFGADELIVSKTDRRGVITYANDVFCRVGAYALDEVIGQPHNLIRHPDMPRAVFALLWDTISAGQELFAYINNLAKDGANYWVLAHVTPSFDERGQIVGYHSNRRRPSPGALAQVRPLYTALLDEERRHPTARAAVAASSELLTRLVAERAASYEDLIWSIIGAEEN
ncbi:PAS domain-containing protein [Klenkia taihuensis]|uniref:PAS domain S-box-containing protein n=1 Tax=Klenkia taihuensis TaxID=1225127 RepID=A0A1I1ID68_9ACTN|nr:PAS domain-containing protein [Klenkia taihuensis]GHE08685.1 chemotaxis protein [Klenkia taihuensis]SFC34164.1 PAS domain S-box-containing protein [Klenkia taihuensis]